MAVTLESLDRKLESALAVLVDLAQQVRKLRDAETTVAVDDKPGTVREGLGASVRFKGAVWTIAAGGVLQSNGGSNPATSLTSNAKSIGIDSSGNLVHTTSNGSSLQTWAYNGTPDWTLVQTKKAPVLSGSAQT